MGVLFRGSSIGQRNETRWNLTKNKCKVLQLGRKNSYWRQGATRIQNIFSE